MQDVAIMRWPIDGVNRLRHLGIEPFAEPVWTVRRDRFDDIGHGQDP
jgi:hypothetical protein